MAKIFISHSSLDKEIAHMIGRDLENHGYKAWLDDWDIKVGENIVERINKAIAQAEFLLVLLSRNSVSSGWVGLEVAAATFKEMEQKDICILPVRLDNEVDIPILLKPKKYIDLSKNYNDGFLKLIEEIDSLKKKNKPHKINVWFLDDDRKNLATFKKKHGNHFAVKTFDNVSEFLEELKNQKSSHDEFPDIALVDLYAPMNEFEVNRQKLREAKEKLAEFFRLEKELKTYVDRAWEPSGIEVVNQVRSQYKSSELPIAIYTQRGLVLLKDHFILELENQEVHWLLKKQFSSETNRLMLNKMIHKSRRSASEKKVILLLDDNPKFQQEFIKDHGNFYDIECISGQGEVLEKIDKLKRQDRFPDLLLVDLYYPKGDDDQSQKWIKEANQKLKEFHEFENNLKGLIKETHEPIGIEVIKEIREMFKEIELPVLLYSHSGLLMLDENRIQKVIDLDTGWLLKDRYGAQIEQIKIIGQIRRLKKISH